MGYGDSKWNIFEFTLFKLLNFSILIPIKKQFNY